MQAREPKHSRPRRPMLLQIVLAGSLLLLALVLFPFLSKLRTGSGGGGEGGDDLNRLTNRAKFHYDQGEPEAAIALLEEALALNPTHPDTLLNLANAHLLANQTSNAVWYAQQVLELDHNSAAAYYVAGCAHSRERNYAAALQSLQQAKDLDPVVGAVTFQLARAHQELGHLEEAIIELEELVGFEPEHPAAHYALSQLYNRTGRPDEAQQELARHQQILAARAGAPANLATFERCKYTELRVPFQLEQPAQPGIAVTFTDATSAAFGEAAARYRGPLGVLDLNNDAWHSLFVVEGDGAFRFLRNSNGVFQAHGEPLPAVKEAKYHQVLVAELQPDGFEDVIVLGEQATHVFKVGTNAAFTEATRFAGLGEVSAIDGALVDLDFTGKLDLLSLAPGGTNVRSHRNLGSFFFQENTEKTGLPEAVPGATQLVVDDWNNDDLPDVFLARPGQAPLLLTKSRGGPLTATNTPTGWPPGDILATGDLNNDLRTDVVIGAKGQLVVVLNGIPDHQLIPTQAGLAPTRLHLVDYDNDGWLDLFLVGETGLRAWRNLGVAGWRDVSTDLGLHALEKARIDDLVAADLDRDGDTDLALSIARHGLKLLRNDGGNANFQLKVRLLGNRSNPSGLGIRLELIAGGLRTSRTVTRLPIEIGVGRNREVDSLTVRWFDLAVSSVEIQVAPDQMLTLEEIQLPTGSCPYLYVWDGQQFRFVTDVLSASPAGLPVAEGRYVEADTDELLWIGNPQTLQPRDGAYVLQITEELREVLYLDEAALVVVDHPPETEVHSTSKMLPGRPFPRPEIVTVHNRLPLRRAVNHEGTDVTTRLQAADGELVSPTRLRVPQLRGLAEPSSVTLDFGPLDESRPLVLVMTGWLRFGGGMANVGASHDPELPFPFPRLEVQTAAGAWEPVAVEVGVPAGKTKTIVTDLAGKLPPGSRQLRLHTAFELHWDRIALFEKQDGSNTRLHRQAPDSTDLHWRGFSAFADLPWHYPLTPVYNQVTSRANWRITPSGWYTRYGPVDDLIARKDNALALIGGGDELTLHFDARRLPPVAEKRVRDFFLFSVGWDKDADFHVAAGTTVDPIPWHGMDDQLYGRQARPAFTNDGWIARYNTRWVGPYTLARP